VKGKAVVVIDYGMGNLFSVASALRYLGCDPQVTDDPLVVGNAAHVILPGVGSFRLAMERLRAKGLDDALRECVRSGRHLLGICLGMQLLGASSTEDGDTAGLGIIPNSVQLFSESVGVKIPHVGFNEIVPTKQSGLFERLPDHPFFYFVHSYRMSIGALDCTYATSDYGERFLAAFDMGNVCGTQFHPEKSQANGLQLLRNFLIR
jgi:glutamine amidotransferase